MYNNKMKLLMASLLACSSLAFAGSISSPGSPHNLGGKTAGDNGEICVYCHTPHAANVAFAGAPLWNKQTLTSTFTMYGATIAGNSTDASPASPSLACLSCHDGISAVDSILNAPGSGMGALAAGTANIVDILATPYGGNIGGTPGVATAGTVGDLSNDHPVSIAYAGTGLADSPASLRAPGDTLPVGTGGAWIGGTVVGDLLRNGNVECSSCHDPHNGGKIQGTDTEVNYLRHTNTNSELCLGCHNK